MNKKAQKTIIGFGLLIVVFALIITAFATVEPLKETLTSARNSIALNCIGTDGFNQTAFNEDTTFERLVRRPTCFVTGLSLVYFIGTVLIASIAWLANSWRKTTR